MPSGEAWVTLATNDSYSLGAIVLSRSLRRTNTTRELVVMITPGVSAPMSEILKSEFTEVIPVNILDSEDSANLALLSRPELGITFTKLHCWRLTQYTKCVFLDADTLVLQSCDELFNREEFSAAPDSGWPDCFNSGVFVFRPSLDTYAKLLEFAVSTGSFDGGDQGLLNLYFSDWSVADISKHLPFIYNVCASATYSYLPAYRVFGQNAKIVHFIGQAKPWLQFYDTATGTVRAPEGQAHLQELLQAWWDIFKGDVHHKLTTEMDGESATMVEQVQSAVSHVFSASQRDDHHDHSPHTYQQHSHDHNNHHHHNYHHQPFDSVPYDFTGFVAPDLSQLHVAIQRYPPENVQRAMEKLISEQNFIPATKQQNEDAQTHPPPSPHHNRDNRSSNVDPASCDNRSSNVDPASCDNRSSNVAPTSCESPEDESCSSHSVDDDGNGKGLAGAFAKISLEGQKSGDQIREEELLRKHAWEQGHIDYLGKDSFDNILKKIQASMAQAQAGVGTSAEKPPPSAPTSTPQPESPTTTQEALETPEISRSAPEMPLVAPLSPGPASVKAEEISSPTMETHISQLSIEPLSVVLPVVVDALKQDAPPPADQPQLIPDQSTVTSAESAVSTTTESKEAKVVPEVAHEVVSDVVPEVVSKVVPEVVSEVVPEVVAEVGAPLPTREEEKETELKIEAAATESATVPEASPAVDTAAASVAVLTEEEQEEERLRNERLAIEKKLADQKRIAEQKLEEEKKAAAAAKAETEAARAAAAAVGEEAAAQVEAPKAPPRKQSKGKK